MLQNVMYASLTIREQFSTRRVSYFLTGNWSSQNMVIEDVKPILFFIIQQDQCFYLLKYFLIIFPIVLMCCMKHFSC